MFLYKTTWRQPLGYRINYPIRRGSWELPDRAVHHLDLDTEGVGGRAQALEIEPGSDSTWNIGNGVFPTRP